MLIRVANIIALVVLPSASCTTTQAVSSAEAACAVATARVTAQRGLEPSHVAFCDDISEGDTPAGYYVTALRAHCSEDLCGSTNMGWFAVQKATGEVFEVEDVTDWRLGRRVPDVR
ncbi:hypothetical protein [Brevundimonas faecalis]|uniref:Lipoprotein n=1 Tax=Brevundimonas faecalis TaxID=947378 RepID=A0ABV2R9X1_9CAUL